MAKKDLIPEIRFAGFTEDWVKQELGKLLEITSASRVHKHQWTKSGVPFFRSSDVIADYKGLENNKAFISFELFEELSTISGRVQKDDLLVTGGGSIGIPYLVKSKKPLYFKDGDLLWLKNSKNISGYFLYLFFKTLIFRRYVKSITHIGTISHYTIEQAKATPITLPNKVEQIQIGSFLNKFDEILKMHQKKYDKLVVLKKAMLDKMFPKKGADVPEIRFKGFGGVWEEFELGTDIADILGGGTPSTSNLDYWDGEIDWYSPSEIGKKVYANGSIRKITELGLEKSSAQVLPAGRTILFTSRAGIGDRAILQRPGTTNQGFQSLVLKKGYDTYFIYSMGDLIKKYAEKYASGSTFLEISSKRLGRMKIRVPTNQEQKKIGNYFKNLDKLINLHQQELNKLKTLKKALLEKMFV